MELFYTVVSSRGAIQPRPSLSLGGFQSASKVPNGSLGNLFDEISPYGLQNPQAQYIGLILQNTLDQEIKSLSFWIQKQAGKSYLCNYRLAVVELSPSGQMEAIPSINSKPLYAEFYETSQSDAIELNFFVPFKYQDALGLWIERTVDKNSDEMKLRNDCDHLYEMFKQGIVPETEEEVELKIKFEYASN